MNKDYLPYFERLDEKYKQIYMSWDKEKLIDCIVSNICNGQILLERIDKAIEYIQDRYDGEVLTHTFDKCNVGELLNILKGVDKE